MTSSPHGPYGLGYTRATMAVTVGSKTARWSKSPKTVSVRIVLCNSSAWLESLVIADQHAAVNTFSGLVHTARHTMGVGFTRSRCANRKEAAVHGKVSNWGEVGNKVAAGGTCGWITSFLRNISNGSTFEIYLRQPHVPPPAHPFCHPIVEQEDRVSGL